MRLRVHDLVIWYRNENLLHLYQSCVLKVFDRIPNDQILPSESHLFDVMTLVIQHKLLFGNPSQTLRDASDEFLNIRRLP